MKLSIALGMKGSKATAVYMGPDFDEATAAMKENAAKFDRMFIYRNPMPTRTWKHVPSIVSEEITEEEAEINFDSDKSETKTKPEADKKTVRRK